MGVRFFPFSSILPIIMPTATKEALVETKTFEQPICRFSDRGVQFSIFQNTVSTKNGSRTFYSTTVQARYKDKEGHWKTGHSFDEDQLAILEDFAREARREIRQVRAQERAEKA